METWTVWMKMPVSDGGGFSRIAARLTREQAEWMADQLHFPARAMPDQPETKD